jgi:hypothetical protein
MNRAIPSILLTGLMCVGIQALADDSTNVGAAGYPTVTQSQSLKDCLAKQKAKNSAMSTADATKACEAQKDSADIPKDSQATSPKQ